MPDELGGWHATVPLLLGSAGYAGFAFVWFTLAAYLAPIVEELGLTSALAGLVTGAIPLTYVPLAVASGLVIDRVGPRRAIGVGLLLIGVGQLVRSVAAGFLGLLLPTVVIGVGGTGITFGLPKLVSLLYPPGRTGTASSVYLVGSFVGMAGAFGIGRPVLGPILGGWRPLFLWSGAAVIGLAAIWHLGSVGVPSTSRTSTDDPDDRSWSSMRADVLTIVSHRGMRHLVVLGLVSLFVVHGVMGWLTAILEERGFDPAIAAAATTVLVAARLGGTITIPPVSDRLGARRGALVASGAFLTIGLAGLVPSSTSFAITASAVVLVGIGLGGMLTMVRVLPIEFRAVGPALTGTATGVIFSVGQVGGFLGPVLLGYLFDLTGSFEAGLGALATAGAVAIVAAWRLPAVEGRTGD